MSLQNRLAYLLIAFTAFALIAAFGTVYGVRLQVQGELRRFQRSFDDAAWTDRVRLQAREQYVTLQEIIEGVREADDLYHAQRDAFFATFDQVARFAAHTTEGLETDELLELGARLRQESDRCLQLVDSSERESARDVLRQSIGNRLLPALELRLRTARTALEESRDRTMDDLIASNRHVLVFALLTGVFGIGLVAVGTALFRRWVIMPVRTLRKATDEFGRGNLGFRVKVEAQHELGSLGKAMNRMAQGLAEAQADLRSSDAKHRSLFENLRDAVVVCDGQGRIAEYHGGDTNLLGALDEGCLGRHLLDVWPHWRAVKPDWPALIERVLDQGTQVRIPDLKLGTGRDGKTVVDLIAYPVEYGDSRYVALVLLDATERLRLERQTRQAEAMEATINFARGIAHDFGNLLTSAVASLSRVSKQLGANGPADGVQRALRSCQQAVGLSRRLLGFAGGNQGHPRLVCLGETVELILGSFDGEFFKDIHVHADCAKPVWVRIDPDQLTQIILNLIHNAREAMSDRGDLHIQVAEGRPTPSASTDAPFTHAILTVTDTGCGMSPETAQRVYEPFFTTKPETSHRSRGLGLAVVYAAVKNANGLIHLSSEPGAGTTLRVCLPLAEGAPMTDAALGSRPSQEVQP